MGENESKSLTPSQREALFKAWDILSEHFEQVVVAYSTTCDDDGAASVFDCNYHGGFTAAIGLVERAKYTWLKPDAGAHEDHWKSEG